ALRFCSTVCHVLYLLRRPATSTRFPYTTLFRSPCSAATIIDTLGIPKSTAYLLLNELRRQRFLSLDHQENFCLWTRLVELSGHALSKMDLRELARPRLTQLMDTSGLLCRVGVFVGGGAYWVLRVESCV